MVNYGLLWAYKEAIKIEFVTENIRKYKNRLSSSDEEKKGLLAFTVGNEEASSVDKHRKSDRGKTFMYS